MLFRIRIGQKPRRLEKSIILLHTKQVRPRSNPMSSRKHVTLLFNIFSIETDGFIHATHDAKLLIDVLNHFYQDIDDTFICLEIDTTKLDSEVKMESPAPVGEKKAKEQEGSLKFPHIYGPIKPLSCVTKQMRVVRDEKGTFLKIVGL